MKVVLRYLLMRFETENKSQSLTQYSVLGFVGSEPNNPPVFTNGPAAEIRINTQLLPQSRTMQVGQSYLITIEETPLL